MVVCRLRKNNDFRRNNPDKAASSKVQVSGEDGDGGVGEKVGGESDRFSKNCSSSFDSHSLEQIDSAIESNHKQTADPALHEPLSREKVSFIIFKSLNFIFTSHFFYFFQISIFIFIIKNSHPF